MLVEFLNEQSEEFVWRGPRALGYMHAYALTTNAQMLAILVHEGDQVYEILFSFGSLADQDEFLCLLQTNEVTACDDEHIVVPPPEDIEEARPIAEVLPAHVLRELLIVSKMTLPTPDTLRPN